MDKKDILRKVDHTLLKQTATTKDIENLIDKAIENECASVCIPPYFVASAYEYAKGLIPICTVIGFPNGYSATDIKVAETEKALRDGASEIDMVININLVKEGKYGEVEREIRILSNICHMEKAILKVIIETCLLEDDEIRKMCEVVARGGADYIKTSTGFSTGGATRKDIKIMKEEMDKWNEDASLKQKFPEREKIKIKASGGISGFEDAEDFIELGADRLGTSRLIK